MKLCTTGLFLALCAGPAFADTIAFSTWSGANGQTSYTNAGATLSANFGTLSISSSGAGINGGRLDYSPSEINQIEVLTLTFATPQNTSEIDLAKLVANEGIKPLTYNERGEYRVNGGSWIGFTATNTNGLLALSVSLTGVNQIDFRPANPGILNVLYDYSLASVTTVPEPATGAVMLSALGVGLLLTRRRRRA